jgi:DNA repair exonuclease SbcCD nuclease subunit
LRRLAARENVAVHANNRAKGAADRPVDPLIVAHTSDLHLGGRWHTGGELSSLRAVLDAAEETRAHVLILAGDVFDSHRAPPHIVEGAAEMMGAAACQIVILPGNHDPATPDAVYRRDGLSRVPNVHVLGVTVGDSIRFAGLGLEVTGVPHVAYADMTPLAAAAERTMPWHVVVAHGHWVTGPHDAHRGWLIHDHEIAASGADYVALGHWDLPQPAGDGSVLAYYSGSPELARTVNVVRFATGEPVEVRRHPLRFAGS